MGITAYDNQQIRNLYQATNGQANTGMAVFMALQLYLDFINLFLAILRIFGKTTNEEMRGNSHFCNWLNRTKAIHRFSWISLIE